jgi:Icc-related predicted phosphoesterase
MANTRIFFTTDLHGSQSVFTKFLNAAKFYKADVIIVGGDITGKMIVPVLNMPGGKYKAQYLGSEMILNTDEELAKFKKLVHSSGFYIHETTEEQMREFNENPKKVDELFLNVTMARIEEWVKIADEKLRGSKVQCFIMPGNDDRFEIDEPLKHSERIINPEGTIQMIGGHEMISTGHANVTPWHCPRDMEEKDLEARIDTMASKLAKPSNAIFCFHVPPYDSGLDTAPVLDTELRPKLDPSGGLKMGPVGSTAVRKSIEKYQPLMGLHGHIHESRAATKIGRTLCLNPGSEYGEGILRGVVIVMDEEKVKDYAFTQG